MSTNNKVNNSYNSIVSTSYLLEVLPNMYCTRIVSPKHVFVNILHIKIESFTDSTKGTVPYEYNKFILRSLGN